MSADGYLVYFSQGIRLLGLSCDSESTDSRYTNVAHDSDAYDNTIKKYLKYGFNYFDYIVDPEESIKKSRNGWNTRRICEFKTFPQSLNI